MNGAYTEVINKFLDDLTCLATLENVPTSAKPIAVHINDQIDQTITINQIMVGWKNKYGEIDIFIDPETYKIIPNRIAISKELITQGLCIGLDKIYENKETRDLFNKMQFELKSMLDKYTKKPNNPNSSKR